ncbi:MAG: rod shape-determining protein RodA [Phycisphaerae bacterium]|nr:rod shape-determining protein RodA [Phycisphaerae bacterium]
MPEIVKRYLRYTSWPIIAAMIALVVVGLTAIDLASGDSLKQAIYACVSLGGFVVATVVPYKRIGRAAYPFFAATVVLLVVVFFLPPIKQAHRWIDLRFFRVQPSEIAKLAYILMLGWYLRYRDNYRTLRGLVVPFVLTFVPMALILPEPDLGTTLLFLPTLFVMLFVAGAKMRHLFGILAVGVVILLAPVPMRVPSSGAVVPDSLTYGTFERSADRYVLTAAPVAMMSRHPHQIDRVVGWLNQGEEDEDAPAGVTYQLIRSKMVLGAGRWTGRGAWNNSDAFFGILPERHNDFIFSVICGQWGFAGAMAVLFLYGVIFLFGLEIATVTHDPFGRLLAVGVLALLFAQIWINIGMTMGLVPVTGMTLPLVSYGGSSLVVNCFALGLLVNVGQRRPILLEPRPFEHDRKRDSIARTPNAR